MTSRNKKYLDRITDPRIKRVTFGAIYFVTAISGLVAFLNLPTLLIREIGPTMITVFGCFVLFGSIVALIGVIVNYAWVERIGLILLVTAIVMYAIMLSLITSITIAVFFVSALAISLLGRFIDIRVEGRTG